MKLSNLKQLSANEIAAIAKTASADGILHFKYIPKTEEWSKADIAYTTFTPGANPNQVVQKAWRGDGMVEFHPATWEDLPTFFPIVNAFHDLEIKEYRGAMMVKTVGSKDLSDQRILR